MAPMGGGKGQGEDSVDRLARVIETQKDATKENTAAFVEIKGKLTDLQQSMENLRTDLNNGGFTRLENRLCEEVKEGDDRILAAMQTVAKDSSAALSTTFSESLKTTSINLPKMGWVALVLFFLVMLVALGVKIPDLVQFFKGF